jgi:hypothetical protein
VFVDRRFSAPSLPREQVEAAGSAALQGFV